MVNKTESSSKDLGDRKRRKVSSSGGTDFTPKFSKDDMYQSVITYEDQEAKKRPAEKDSTLFEDTCAKLRNVFDEVSELKKQPQTESVKAKLEEKRVEGSLIFVLMKKLNRLDKLRVRSDRDALHKEKLQLQSQNLQLQNLLYEAEHLKKEVQRCREFKSQDEEIELVDVNEFYEKAPATISRPEKTKKDEHSLRLARLEWELEQRKELDQQLKEVVSTKKQLSKDIVSKTDRLLSLKPQLENLLVATRPLQDALDMKFEAQWQASKAVRLLPDPLYLFYTNITAYGEAIDSLLLTTVNGDEDEAIEDHEPKEIETAPEENTPDSDQDDNEVDTELEPPPKKRHHHGRPSKTALIGQKRDILLKCHPLNVTTIISKEEKGPGLAVTFNYFPNLNIVTVQAKLINMDVGGVAARDVISADTILKNLYPNDVGDESPNPRNKFQLDDIHLTTTDLMSYLAEKGLGKPYKWAQKACGLDIVAGCRSATEVCETTAPVIVKQIRARLIARIKLYKQIHALENGKTDKLDDKLPLRISGTLLQWTSISFEEYSACPATTKFIEGEDFESDLFYRAIITRGAAKLECYIRVSINYPDETPLWALALTWNGKHDTTNDSSLKEIECIVNSIDINKKSRTILWTQLKKVMSCLDVYLETESGLAGSNEFSMDKSFLKAVRGRHRAHPYRTVSNGSGVIYTQM